MTPLEYTRWKDFALRMARTCYYGNRRPTSKWIVEVVEDFFQCFDESGIPCIVNWDNSTDYPVGHRYHGTDYYGHANRPYGVGDMMSVFLDEYEGYAPRCKPCRIYEHPGKCRCDEIDSLFHEQWQEQWGGPIHCCIRAGLDFAANPSVGVLGFTAGDIRRMYPEGVPDWVFPPDEKLRIFMTDEVNGTFAELPDSAGVVM